MPWWIVATKFGVRQRFALVVGYGNQRHFAEARIERPQITQILPAVEHEGQESIPPAT